MNLETWIRQELDDVVARLEDQVWALVPQERRHERPGGGNSINWATYHIARHAELALAVLGYGEAVRSGSFGLGEREHEGPEELDSDSVESYARGVFHAARAYALSVDPGRLDVVTDASVTLAEARVPRDEFSWLYQQWAAQPAAFFVRWPLTSHATNHVGEMIATRNRLGLSPYSS